MRKYFLKQNIAFSVIMLVLFSIYSIVLANLSTRFANDILVPEALTLIIDVSRAVFEILIWSTLTAFLLIRFYESDTNRRKFIFFAFPIIDILQYIISIVAAWIYDGRPSETSDLIQSFLDSMLFIILDNLRFLVIAIICYRLTKSGLQKYKVALKAANSLNDGDINKAEKFRLLPFKQIFSFDNNIQRSIFFCSLFYSLVLIVSRIIYDIDYGLPSDLTDAMWMITYYLLDIVRGAIYYIVSVAILNLLYKLHKKAMLS